MTLELPDVRSFNLSSTLCCARPQVELISRPILAQVVELEMPYSRAVRKFKQQNAPWWLEPGTEVCPACNHAYVIQTEYRCVACDVVICAMCVDGRIAAEISCVTCGTHASGVQDTEVQHA